MAVAVVVLTLSSVAYGVGTSRGHGFVRLCVEKDMEVPPGVQIIALVGASASLLATVPPAVLLLTLAATPHLRSIAFYLWVTWLNKVISFLYTCDECASATSGRDSLVAEAGYIVFVNGSYALSVALYLVLLSQRLRALELSSFRQSGVRAFQLSLRLFSFFAALNIPMFLLRATLASAAVDAVCGTSLWLQTVFFLITGYMAVRAIHLSRSPLLLMSVAGPRCHAAEASQAAQAMNMQMLGVVVGFVSTVCKATLWCLKNDSMWPVSHLVDGTVPLFVALEFSHVLDDLGNIFSVLALSGCLSGALRGNSKGLARQEQRRRRWARSAEEWRKRHRMLGPGWQEMVEELAGRGISVEAILRFYRSLGATCMEHYDPALHTTADVVWQAIIPSTRASRSALSSVLMQGQYCRPHKMVTHNWGNLFHDLVAAIIADALDEPKYAMVSSLLQRDAGKLERWLIGAGKHTQVYWVCALCVNQHRSICELPAAWRPADPVTGAVPPACPCGLAKALNETGPTLADGRSIPCEMNKFDHMIQFLAATDPHFGHIIAVDAGFVLFSRAWCMSEISAGSAMGMEQHLELRSADDLTKHEDAMRSVRIEEMSASRPEDKQAILAAIPDVEEFNRHLQSLLFDDLIPAWNDLDASEQMLRAGRLIRWQGVFDEGHAVGCKGPSAA